MIGCGSRRSSLIVGAFFTLLLLIIFYHHDDLPDVPQLRRQPPPKQTERLDIQPAAPEQLNNVHLLLPASSGKKSLCKTLLTAAVLGYPVPTLLSWDETFHSDHLIGGGRHIAKIEKVLEWLEAQPDSNNDDLVIIVDAYGGFNYHTDSEGLEAHKDGEAWFQLPLEVLVQRYHAVNEKANADLKESLGDGYEREEIKQDIIFGASKRCTPSDAESSACYPIPESPLPKNLYGKYTDDMKYNHTTHLPRYLSSAYTLGPVSSLRTLFRRANEKSSAARNPVDSADPSFNASLELGSDQAIFSHIFGEQEYQREIIRRKFGGQPRGKTVVEGTPIEDVLDPAMPHDMIQEKDGHPDEFGIGLDHWTDLGMSTYASEDDARWLTYDEEADTMPQQMLARHRKSWNCVPHVQGILPSDVLNSTNLPRAAISDASQFSPKHGWEEIPLYTNICVDTIPVIVNHNGDKKERERDWPEMWVQPHGRRLIEEVLDREDGVNGAFKGGAFDGLRGKYRTWGQLCPANVENELYRDR